MTINTTFGANVNEIMLGFFLLDKTWDKYQNAIDAQKALTISKQKLPFADYDIQVLRAKQQAKEVIKWMKNNNYNENIKMLWWVGSNNMLEKIIGKKINNPSDIILKFSNNKLLGISAKS